MPRAPSARAGGTARGSRAPTPTRRSGPARSASARSRSAHATSPIASRVVEPGGERRRAAADREVGVAHFRRHRPRRLARARRDARPAAAAIRRSSAWSTLPVGDVALERLLVADRDPLRRRLERREGRCRARGRAAAGRPCREAAAAARRRRAPRAAPIVSSPAARSRSSARGPDAGERAARRTARGTPPRGPAGTTVRPPGLRRSLATFATTLHGATPSEHERRGGAAHRRLHRLGDTPGVRGSRPRLSPRSR